MPTGIYKRTEKTKRAIKEGVKKQKYNKGRFKKGHISIFKGTHIQTNTGQTHFKKGHTSWNKGLKGLKIGWKKGAKFSEEHKRNISKAGKGRKVSEETKRNLSKIFKGRKFSEEWRRNLSKSKKGKKNYNWKGGVEIENKRIRKSIEFRLWREAIFARDTWTCQKCGGKAYKNLGKRIILHPHHIKNFAQYKELRFAIDNGITFCKKCHKLFHKIYGVRNNTIEQLKEFLL